MSALSAWARGAAVLVGLMATPVSAMTFIEVEYVCPIGGERFRQNTMGSGTTYGHFLDGKGYGAIQSPWPLVQCPSNGFVLFKHDFSKDELKRLTPFVESDEYQKMRGHESSYWLLARLLEKLDAPLLERASALQRATWEASTQDYPRYVAAASAAFGQQCPDELPVNERDEAWLYCQMLLGEWERRLSRLQQAQLRFERLLPLPDILVGDADRQQQRAQYALEIRQQLALIAERDTRSVMAEDAAAPKTGATGSNETAQQAADRAASAADAAADQASKQKIEP